MNAFSRSIAPRAVAASWPAQCARLQQMALSSMITSDTSEWDVPKARRSAGDRPTGCNASRKCRRPPFDRAAYTCGSSCVPAGLNALCCASVLPPPIGRLAVDFTHLGDVRRSTCRLRQSSMSLLDLAFLGGKSCSISATQRLIPGAMLRQASIGVASDT